MCLSHKNNLFVQQWAHLPFNFDHRLESSIVSWISLFVNFVNVSLSNRKGKLYPLCKCFTCVTKTIANLATYSRKPENYNGTIIFEFDIMKNSSPINLNLCQTWLFHLLFILFWFTLNWAESAVCPAEKKCYFGFEY